MFLALDGEASRERQKLPQTMSKASAYAWRALIQLVINKFSLPEGGSAERSARDFKGISSETFKLNCCVEPEHWNRARWLDDLWELSALQAFEIEKLLKLILFTLTTAWDWAPIHFAGSSKRERVKLNELLPSPWMPLLKAALTSSHS